MTAAQRHNARMDSIFEQAMRNRTPGQIAYEADCKAYPTYHDGTPRKWWSRLGEAERWSWERNPTPR